MLLWRLAWRNLWRGWRRSTVVLTAITLGLGACLLLVAWTRGLAYQMADNAIRSRLGHVVVEARGYRDDPDPSLNLPDGGAAVLALLVDAEGVHAAPRLIGDGLVQSARRSVRGVIVGVDPLREPRVSNVATSIVEGEYLSPEPVAGRALPSIVLGRGMAERLRLGVGDKLVLHVPGEAGLGAFRIVGLFVTASSEFDRSFVFIRIAEAQRLLAVAGAATEVALTLDRPGRASAVQARLRRALAGQGVEVLRWQERAPRLAVMLNSMDQMGWIFYAAVFVAMSFGIANALLMSVFERIREFGVLRSLGLPGRRLVALVLAESTLLTLLGVALGTGVGGLLVLWLGSSGIDLAAFSSALRAYGAGAIMYPRLGWADLVTPIELALATALLAGSWPAWRVARLQPAEALRGR